MESGALVAVALASSMSRPSSSLSSFRTRSLCLARPLVSRRALSLSPPSLSLSLSLSLPPPPLLPGSLGEVRRERDALASLAKAERTEAALRVAELEATQERLQEQANERMECVPRPRGHRGIRRFPFLP